MEEKWAVILLGEGRVAVNGAPLCDGDTPSRGDAGRWYCTRTDRTAETPAEQLKYKGGMCGGHAMTGGAPGALSLLIVTLSR